MVETTTAHPDLLADEVVSLLPHSLEAVSVVLSSGVRDFETAGVLRIPKRTRVVCDRVYRGDGRDSLRSRHHVR